MKAILVLDEMPKSCIECPFYYEYEQAYFCKTLKKITGAKDKCPLKPMPEKKEVLNISDNNNDIYEVFANKINVGYNRCIDELLGVEDND